MPYFEPDQAYAGVSNLGNTQGNTGVGVGRLVLAGTNNVTLSQATDGVGSTITISAAGGGAGQFSGGVSNVGNTAGATGVSGTRMVLVGTNGITLSQTTDANGNTISISAGGGGGFSLGVSTGGSTSGATGVTGSRIVLVGADGIGLTQTTDANGATITIDGGATTRTLYEPYDDREFIAGQVGQGTLQLNPDFPPSLQFDRLIIPIAMSNATNSSGSHTISYWLGLYTRNVSTLSLYASSSGSTAVTMSGTAGSYSLYSGVRLFTIGWTTTITEGRYWYGFLSRTTSGGANGSYSNMLLSNQASNFVGLFGSSNNTTQQYVLGQGVYTATTNAMPNSIGFSQIRGSDSNNQRPPVIMFASGTV